MRKILGILLLIFLMSGCSRQKKEELSEIYDLSSLNETIAYSQLVNIIKDPEDYLGKGIRLRGIYSVSFNAFTHDYNHTVTIQDNTQCCAQGIEFILKKNGDYPDDGEEVTLSGIIDLFEEGKHSYCYIRDAVIE